MSFLQRKDTYNKETNENTLSGRTDTNKVVVIDADKSYIDKIVNVKISFFMYNILYQIS